MILLSRLKMDPIITSLILDKIKLKTKTGTLNPIIIIERKKILSLISNSSGMK